MTQERFRAKIGTVMSVWQTDFKLAVRDLYERIQVLKEEGLNVGPLLYEAVIESDVEFQWVSCFDALTHAVEEEWILNGEWKEDEDEIL
jgi:hypothetical protein